MNPEDELVKYYQAAQTPEERREAMRETIRYMQGMGESEARAMLGRLRDTLGITPENEGEIVRLQQAYMDAVDQLNGDDDCQSAYGFSEQIAGMYMEWLEMMGTQLRDLDNMSKAQSYAAGVLIGIKVGMVIRDAGVA